MSSWVGPMPPLLLSTVSMASWTLAERSGIRVPSDYKIVAVTHPTDGLDNFFFIVGNDFDPLEVLVWDVDSEPVVLLCCLAGGRDLQFPSWSTILPCSWSLSIASQHWFKTVVYLSSWLTSLVYKTTTQLLVSSHVSILTNSWWTCLSAQNLITNNQASGRMNSPRISLIWCGRRPHHAVE